jgi:hypothetical protein
MRTKPILLCYCIAVFVIFFISLSFHKTFRDEKFNVIPTSSSGSDYDYVVLQYANGSQPINCWSLHDQYDLIYAQGHVYWNDTGTYVTGTIVVEHVLNNDFNYVYEKYHVTASECSN